MMTHTTDDQTHSFDHTDHILFYQIYIYTIQTVFFILNSLSEIGGITVNTHLLIHEVRLCSYCI